MRTCVTIFKQIDVEHFLSSLFAMLGKIFTESFDDELSCEINRVELQEKLEA